MRVGDSPDPGPSYGRWPPPDLRWGAGCPIG